MLYKPLILSVLILISFLQTANGQQAGTQKNGAHKHAITQFVHFEFDNILYGKIKQIIKTTKMQDMKRSAKNNLIMNTLAIDTFNINYYKNNRGELQATGYSTKYVVFYPQYFDRYLKKQTIIIDTSGKKLVELYGPEGLIGTDFYLPSGKLYAHESLKYEHSYFKISERTIHDITGARLLKETYQYGDDGRLTEIYDYDKTDKLKDHVSILYQNFDKNKNWTKRSVFRRDRYNLVIEVIEETRRITYN